MNLAITLVIAEARALKNVKQFLQNPHDVYRIEGFLAATKKGLISYEDRRLIVDLGGRAILGRTRVYDSTNRLIPSCSELKIIKTKPI